jgi:hypothetical protein
MPQGAASAAPMTPFRSKPGTRDVIRGIDLRTTWPQEITGRAREPFLVAGSAERGIIRAG